VKRVRILQLACYQGNIGDNANIVGTRTLLNQNLPFEIEYTDLDIMDYLWKFKRFDSEFAELANRHDLMIIGGGGYFELTDDQSCTGTPLDISLDILKEIKVPVVFYSLGMDIARGVNEDRVNKFRKFLDHLLSSNKILISVRNDGTMDNVKILLGDEYASRIYQVPDGGFFTVVKDFYHPELPDAGQVIGINLAGDMPDFRFRNTGNVVLSRLERLLGDRLGYGRQKAAKISTAQFLVDFAALMNECLGQHNDLGLVLIPHIYKDMNIISQFMSRLPSYVNRRRVTVAPYLHGQSAQDYIFDLYRKCNLIMGMRFHASVCGIGLNVPTIGLVTYPQIEHLYRTLGISDKALKVNEGGFEKKLLTLIDESLNNPDSVKQKFARIREKLLEEASAFHVIMQKLF
jgi:polysaccharide pyruvyl transferase WcaK-like protein